MSLDGNGRPRDRRPEPERVGLATLTARIALELDALAALAEALDGRLAHTGDADALRDPRYGAQDLDRLRRIAGDLATVQRRLADVLSDEVSVPIAPTLGRLQLGGMAHRLRTGSVNDGGDTPGGEPL